MHKNNNSELLWGTTTTIWGLHGHNNNNKGTAWVQKYNKGVVIITIRGYTSSKGA